MLFGIEHLVRQARFHQHLGQQLRQLDGGGAHQDGLTALVAFTDVIDGGFVFLVCGFVDAVQLVVPLAGLVGRDQHGFQTVNFLELVGLGVGGTRHATQLVVQAEVILERDGSHGLVFSLDGHTFFGFHRLVQAVAPTPSGHQTARELVNDDDFTRLVHIVLVQMVEVVGTQSGIQVMHQANVGRVVERCASGQQPQIRQNFFGFFMAQLGEVDLMGFFIQGEVAGGDDALTRAQVHFAFLAGQVRHHFVHRQIGVGVVFGLTADDERCAGFVNQDGVHLVDDGVVQQALHPLGGFIHHVVTQVIETVFVVGAVSDVGLVSRLFFFAAQLRQIDAHAQAQKVVEPTHPLRVSVGQIIVDRDHMHALAAQGIEVDRQCGGQGFALAGAHLGNLALVQGNTTHHLHIKVAHFHDTLGALAHHGKCLRQQVVQTFTSLEALFELVGFGPQNVVVQGGQAAFQSVDALNGFAVLLEEPVVAAAKDVGQ